MALFKKESKKVGQAELVKLLPKLVSKGLGNGALVGTLEAVINEDAVGLEDVNAEELAELVVDGDCEDAVEVAIEVEAMLEVDRGVAVVEPNGSPPCRGEKRRSLRPTRGMGRRSKIISPLLAISASSALPRYFLMSVPASDMPHSIANTMRAKIHA